MNDLSPKGRALLKAYRDVSEVDDQPDAAVFERIEASIVEAEAPAKPRRAAAWLVAGFAVASGAAAVVAWPSAETTVRHSTEPATAAPDQAEPAEEGGATSSRRVPPTPSSAPVVEPHDDAQPPAQRPRSSAAPKRPHRENVPASVPADDGLQRELVLLQRARAAMRRGALDDAATALSAHGRAFPTGQLAEDRDAAWVVLRCRRGSKNTGRGAFEAAHPGSHHLAAIRTACDEKNDDVP